MRLLSLTCVCLALEVRGLSLPDLATGEVDVAISALRSAIHRSCSKLRPDIDAGASIHDIAIQLEPLKSRGKCKRRLKKRFRKLLKTAMCLVPSLEAQGRGDLSARLGEEMGWLVGAIPEPVPMPTKGRKRIAQARTLRAFLGCHLNQAGAAAERDSACQAFAIEQTNGFYRRTCPKKAKQQRKAWAAALGVAVESLPPSLMETQPFHPIDYKPPPMEFVPVNELYGSWVTKPLPELETLRPVDPITERLETLAPVELSGTVPPVPMELFTPEPMVVDLSDPMYQALLGTATIDPTILETASIDPSLIQALSSLDTSAIGTGTLDPALIETIANIDPSVIAAAGVDPALLQNLASLTGVQSSLSNFVTAMPEPYPLPSDHTNSYYYPDMGSTYNYPDMGSTYTYPNMDNTNMYPDMGSTYTYPNMGDHTYSYPDMGSTYTYPDMGDHTYNYDMGSTYTYPNMGDHTYNYPDMGGTNNYPDMSYASTPMYPDSNYMPTEPYPHPETYATGGGVTDYYPNGEASTPRA